MSTISELYTSNNWVKLTTGSTFPRTRALWAAADGTATITTGTIDAPITMTSFPMKAGLNPIRSRGITFGTVTEVWGIY